jgi:hypothetical protein
LPYVSCSHVAIDAADPSGQPQSMHLDHDHHTWKHRFKMTGDGKHRVLIGAKTKIEVGSTMLDEYDLEEILDERVADDDYDDDDETPRKEPCGSCYGAGEDDECCNSCEDVRRAYKRRGWVMRDTKDIKQCKNEVKKIGEDGEGCNIHGVVALSSGGGNLHLAPTKDYGSDASPLDNLFEMVLQSFHQWNVSHTVNKIRFGPEYPEAVYQLDGAFRTVTDSSAMYQYYIQVRF